MRSSHSFRGGGSRPLTLVAAFLLAAAASRAGVVAPESPETIGRLIRDSGGRMDLVCGRVAERSAIPNPDPRMRGTVLTRLRVKEAVSLYGQQPLGEIVVVYLGASWSPSHRYGTDIEPPASETAPGRQLLLVVRKDDSGAFYATEGDHRVAACVRNSSGRTIVKGKSGGYFVGASNRDLDQLAADIRAAGAR